MVREGRPGAIKLAGAQGIAEAGGEVNAATTVDFMRTAAVAFLLLSLIAGVIGTAIWSTLGAPAMR